MTEKIKVTKIPKINKRLNKKKSIPKPIKIAVWNKYIGLAKGIGQCETCRRDINQMEFECGHVVAESNGGQIVLDNFRPVCGTCNKSMGTQNLFYFKEKLIQSNQQSLFPDSGNGIALYTRDEINKAVDKLNIENKNKGDGEKNQLLNNIYEDFIKLCPKKEQTYLKAVADTVIINKINKSPSCSNSYCDNVDFTLKFTIDNEDYNSDDEDNEKTKRIELNITVDWKYVKGTIDEIILEGNPNDDSDSFTANIVNVSRQSPNAEDNFNIMNFDDDESRNDWDEYLPRYSNQHKESTKAVLFFLFGIAYCITYSDDSQGEVKNSLHLLFDYE